MDEAPDEMWLQYYGMDADDMQAEYGDDWKEAHEVSWCTEPVYGTDILYIRADKAGVERDALLKTIGEMEVRLRAQAQALQGMQAG